MVKELLLISMLAVSAPGSEMSECERYVASMPVQCNQWAFPGENGIVHLQCIDSRTGEVFDLVRTRQERSGV